MSEADDERAAIVAEGNGARDRLGERLAELVPVLPHDVYLRPPTGQECMVPALGIAHGPPNVFVGASFVGKTIALMSAALDVACGSPWWGVWQCQRRRVLMLDHEQGLYTTIDRLRRLCRARCVPIEEIAKRWWETAVYPALNLRTRGALDLYSRLLDGFGLCYADALKGLTPGVDENSSEMADYMGILREASERTGCVVMLSHHAGKTPHEGSKRGRGEMGRGSSAIKDQAQTWLVATGEKYKPMRVTHEKTRVAKRTVDDFVLRIEDVEVDHDPTGGLRVVHGEVAEVAESREGVDRVRGRILAFFREHAGVVRASRRDIRAMIRVHGPDYDAAFGELVADGIVVRAGNYHRPEFRLGGSEAT